LCHRLQHHLLLLLQLHPWQSAAAAAWLHLLLLVASAAPDSQGFDHATEPQAAEPLAMLLPRALQDQAVLAAALLYQQAS
jgi:hypothetical protein